MIFQSFNKENFRKIYDYENRKGLFLDARFFEEVAEVAKSLKHINEEIIRQKKKYKKNKESGQPLDAIKTRIETLSSEAEKTKILREELLTKNLIDIEQDILKKDFKPDIKPLKNIKNKIIFGIDKKSATNFFLLKQLQINIQRSYNVKQSNRAAILGQLKVVLDDCTDKIIVRADIKSFYECIDQEKLLKKIQSDKLLTTKSIGFIKSILWKYKQLANTSKGLPRGVGISSYLAELYLRDFDHSIRTSDDLIYYARYVDDIICIYALNNPDEKSNCLKKISDIALNISSLSLNPEKSSQHKIFKETSEKFEFLGYEFSISRKKLSLSITEKRLEEYKRRISRIFETYRSQKLKNEKLARKLLIKRLRYFTGNTRLVNNKDNALIGIRFSNAHVDNTDFLNVLDQEITRHARNLDSPHLRNRISKMTCNQGFSETKFTKFSASELQTIVEAWKHD